MAKSSRASRLKSNKTRLRRKVFGPVVDARTERLSQKLQELAAQPKPETEKSEMEVVENKEDETSATVIEPTTSATEDMDVDGIESTQAGKRKQKSKKSGGRIQKRRHRKVQNAMTFPPVKQRRTVSRVSNKK